MLNYDIGTTAAGNRLGLKTGVRLSALLGTIGAAALLGACGGGGGGGGGNDAAPATTLSCDDSIKTGFTQDAAGVGGETTVLLVKQFRKDDPLVLPNSSLPSGVTPLTASEDLCLVKLVVGPGLTSEPAAAPSWSQGIGIEVWLPEKSAWNERIRAYGSGGAGGGFHTDVTKLGPNRGEGNAFQIAAAGKGFVVSHSDTGHVGGTISNFAGGTLTWAMKVDGTPNRLSSGARRR
jgi:feruloyl esterase